MISSRSLQAFTKTNLILWGIGHAFFAVYKLWFGTSFGVSYLIFMLLSYLYLLAKNHMILNLLEMSVSFIAPINPSEPPKEAYKYEFDLYMAKDTITEIITLLIVRTTGTYLFRSMLLDILMYIPVTFAFELVFDFFHYWTHRLGHHRLFYWVHNRHHAHKHPKGITVYYQDFMDLMLTNVLPMFITSWIVPISQYQMAIFMSYKTFIEISGHLGRRLYPTSSFSQFMWLPRALGIELYSEDHDLHHTHFRYNFSKRFSIWDRMFGTFKRPDSTEMRIGNEDRIDPNNAKYSEFSTVDF